jgi:hypothetical protein
LGIRQQKIATLQDRDLLSTSVLQLFRGFYQRANAASAKRLTNRAPIFIDSNFLKIGFEFSVRCPHRVASIMTESGLFATFFTDSHQVVLSPFLRYNYYVWISFPKQQSILPYSTKSYKTNAGDKINV